LFSIYNLFFGFFNKLQKKKKEKKRMAPVSGVTIVYGFLIHSIDVNNPSEDSDEKENYEDFLIRIFEQQGYTFVQGGPKTNDMLVSKTGKKQEFGDLIMNYKIPKTPFTLIQVGDTMSGDWASWFVAINQEFIDSGYSNRPNPTIFNIEDGRPSEKDIRKLFLYLKKLGVTEDEFNEKYGEYLVPTVSG
jgi:hypothetical protein